MSPTDPRPVVYGAVQRALGGRNAAAGAALDDYIFRFGGSAQNLQLVAEPLAETGNLPLLERGVRPGICAAAVPGAAGADPSAAR